MDTVSYCFLFNDDIFMYSTYILLTHRYYLYTDSEVRPHFRFGSEIWNWSENFVSLGSEKKAWFHM